LKQRTPYFRRQEWFRYKRVGTAWRKPRGKHSGAREHLKKYPNVVSIGYRSPVLVRGLHPSGYEEVIVHTPEELAKVNPKSQAVRIARTVGDRKRQSIEEKAKEMKIRVLNEFK